MLPNPVVVRVGGGGGSQRVSERTAFERIGWVTVSTEVVSKDLIERKRVSQRRWWMKGGSDVKK